MYLYISFFDQKSMESGSLSIRGKSFDLIKDKVANYKNLNVVDIKNCIGFIKNKKLNENNIYLLDIDNISVNENHIKINFNLNKELNISNRHINRSLYRYACENDLVDKESGFYPNLCILDKNNFDIIRKEKVNIKKVTSKNAEIEEFKTNNEWKQICDMFEPLEQINNKEIWKNSIDLYTLAFACSKMGELENGKNKDKDHLKFIKKYREFAELFYLRCNQLEPNEFRYPSALGYRYYRNYTELKQQMKRKDGNSSEEIENALKWINKSIELYPESIKDNYRKGKLILDEKINNFKYSNHKWTSETFSELHSMKREGILALNKVIEVYERIKDDNKKKIYLNEYTKSLHCLGKFYLSDSNINIDYYLFNKISNNPSNIENIQEDNNYLKDSKENFEKSWYEETDISLEKDLNIKILSKYKWTISPMDKLYQLGLVYLNMYFVKKINDSEDKYMYKSKAYKYLSSSLEIFKELKRNNKTNRSYWFIAEKLALLNIITEDYEDAIKLLRNAKSSYIKNTYAIALLLSNKDDNIKKAEITLKEAVQDKYNLAKNKSTALLVYTYKIQSKNVEIASVLEKEEKLIKRSSKKYLEFLGMGKLYASR